MEALRRYTNLASALHVLRESEITLLAPNTWDDKNDRRLLETFQDRRALRSVLCLCFAEAPETYHHWKVFSPGMDGICIVFDKQRLTASLDQAKVRHQKVRYYSVGDLSKSPPDVESLPFAKRIAYEPEMEYRLLWTSRTEALEAKSFNIPKDSIDRVIINPWLPKSLVKTVRETLQAIPGREQLKVVQSKVTDGPAWMLFADLLTKES